MCHYLPVPHTAFKWYIMKDLVSQNSQSSIYKTYRVSLSFESEVKCVICLSWSKHSQRAATCLVHDVILYSSVSILFCCWHSVRDDVPGRAALGTQTTVVLYVYILVLGLVRVAWKFLFFSTLIYSQLLEGSIQYLLTFMLNITEDINTKCASHLHPLTHWQRINMVSRVVVTISCSVQLAKSILDI